MTKSEIIRDKRYRKLYGISLETYNTRLAEQNGVCAISGRAGGKKSLSVDHDHRWDRVKIKVEKYGPGRWIAYTKTPTPDEISITRYGTSRRLAKEQVRLVLRRKSIRGLLFFRINKGLQYFDDNPDFLEAAARYLRRYQEQLNTSKGSENE